MITMNFFTGRNFWPLKTHQKKSLGLFFGPIVQWLSAPYTGRMPVTSHLFCFISYFSLKFFSGNQMSIICFFFRLLVDCGAALVDTVLKCISPTFAPSGTTKRLIYGWVELPAVGHSVCSTKCPWYGNFTAQVCAVKLPYQGHFVEHF